MVDGKVVRSADGKELRFPVLLSPQVGDSVHQQGVPGIDRKYSRNRSENLAVETISGFCQDSMTARQGLYPFQVSLEVCHDIAVG